MVFRNFDRLLFAKSEGTPGTAAAISTATDFFEVIEPTFTISPLMFERFTKSQTLTTQTQTVPGATKAAPQATCEISFGLELCGYGSTVATGTKPKMDRLLQACGLTGAAVYTYGVTPTSYSADAPFFHLENVDGVAGVYAAAEAKSFGCNAYGDAEFWALAATTLGDTNITAQHSLAEATATGTGATQVGIGYMPYTPFSDPDTANAAVTLRLYVGGGAYVQAKGCKGTFDIAFTHGDRAIINFTFTGVLDSYTEATTPTDHSYTAELPPAFINTALKLGLDTERAALWDGALFNSIGFSMGNDVSTREDTNAANGFAASVITDRNPTMTFNPDAVLSSGNYDFWDSFLSGSPARMRWSVGTTAGNRIDFRVTSAQFSGISDGDRDSVSIVDSTTNLTGGTFGSSIISDGGLPSGSTFGSENEFQILFR